MKPISLSKPVSPAQAGFALKVATVYQDMEGQEWVAELWHRVTQLMGNDAIVNTSWSLIELDQSAIFSEAVSAASRADVLVVSIHPGEQLSARLCAWIDAWLPRRQRQDGALIALLGMAAGRPDGPAKQAEAYLRNVALRGRLEFLLREQVGALPGSNTFPIDTSLINPHSKKTL
jgi:hypothetical protein